MCSVVVSFQMIIRSVCSFYIFNNKNIELKIKIIDPPLLSTLSEYAPKLFKTFVLWVYYDFNNFTLPLEVHWCNCLLSVKQGCVE